MSFAAVKRLRLLALVCIFVSLPLFAITLLRSREHFWLAAIFAFAALFAFTTTEAFGPFAQTRSLANRVIARAVFAFYTVLVLSIPVFSIVTALR